MKFAGILQYIPLNYFLGFHLWEHPDDNFIFHLKALSYIRIEQIFVSQILLSETVFG